MGLVLGVREYFNKGIICVYKGQKERDMGLDTMSIETEKEWHQLQHVQKNFIFSSFWLCRGFKMRWKELVKVTNA